mgnify:CR=1 FL=1
MRTETRFPVRYAETDQMGVVHHSNYAVWFEAGRTDFLKKAGISNTDVEAKGILLPLYEMNCQFKSPAKYEDEIMVVTSLKKISRVRLCFSYQVLNTVHHKLLATGETMHAWTDKALKPVNADKIIPDVYAVLCQAID